MLKRAIYLDAAASTPIDPRVREVVARVLEEPGNPHATSHVFGARAARIVAEARAKVAALVGASEREIIFTSGATESNNLAIRGFAEHLRKSGRSHVLVSSVEHASVLAAAGALEGLMVQLVPSKPCGMIDEDSLEKLVSAKTGLICLQAVNNEVGTVQPVWEVAKMAHQRGALVHCDAAQALGKIEFDVKTLGIDSASFSSHKLHGPGGIGALYVRSCLRDCLTPLIRGGGQEQGSRSGTLPTALCAGFGEACELTCLDRQSMWELRLEFLGLVSGLGAIVHGHPDKGWQAPGILSLRFPGVEAEALVMALEHIAVGYGSTCAKLTGGHSRVITEIAGEVAARETIRVSFSRMTTIEEVRHAGETIANVVRGIREMER